MEIVLSIPNLDTQTRDICIVGGLFHDVGKIRTLNVGGSSLLGCLVSHDHLTLSICKTALDELEAAWPDGAYTLMHVWTAKMTPYAYERKIPAAHIIAAADRISSESDKHAVAFDKAPSWQPAYGIRGRLVLAPSSAGKVIITVGRPRYGYD